MLLHLRLREVCTGRSGLWWSSESLWWPSDIDWLCWAIQNAARKSPCDKLILTIPHEWISDDRTSSHFFWWTCQAILFKGSHIVRFLCWVAKKIGPNYRTFHIRFDSPWIKIPAGIWWIWWRGVLGAQPEKRPRHQLLLLWCCDQCRLPPHLPHSFLHHRRMIWWECWFERLQDAAKMHVGLKSWLFATL